MRWLYEAERAVADMIDVRAGEAVEPDRLIVTTDFKKYVIVINPFRDEIEVQATVRIIRHQHLCWGMRLDEFFADINRPGDAGTCLGR
jgi:hypothetical protein